MPAATHFSIEQALFGVSPGPSYARDSRPVVAAWACSGGFSDDWLPLAEELMHGFGEQPAGIECPLAVFAHPFGRDHVAVVEVTDCPAGLVLEPHGSLAFHFLIVPRQEYTQFLGDPFHLTKHLPADWQQRGPLPTHSWPCVPLPERSVAEVQSVLKRRTLEARRAGSGGGRELGDTAVADLPSLPTIENAESPALLGGAQVLVDGGKLCFKRPGPDLDLVQGLWTLLPGSTRSQLWPASFAFSNQLGFDVVVLPRLISDEFAGYTSEEQAMDYPEGSFEYRLQFAAERGDQDEVTALLNRRSVRETWRLGVGLLTFLIVLLLTFAILDKTVFKRGPLPPPRPADLYLRAATAASMVSLGDPWGALATLHLGNEMFNKPTGAQP